MPHSPRCYRGKLWLLDSGRGPFGSVDLGRGVFEPIAFCPGYARGLAFHGDYAMVGVPSAREPCGHGDLQRGGALPGVIRPIALGFRNDEVQRMITVGSWTTVGEGE